MHHAGSLTLLVLLTVAPRGAPGLPPLRIDAPETMRPVALQIRNMPPEGLEIVNRLIGSPESSQPIDVVLAPEGSELAASAPPYISGYANGPSSFIVLFPSRARNYPDDGLPELLRHEISHILIYRASGGHRLPRWFQEGLAVTASGRWDLEDRARLTLGMMKMDDLDLAKIEAGFSGSELEVQRSYALSLGFVRYFLHQFGPDSPRLMLERVAAGQTFDQAFFEVTRQPLPDVEREFWRSGRMWNRWIPFFTSSLALWMAITFLALWTIRRRRRKDAKIRELWELEDGLLEPGDTNVPTHPKNDEWIH